ncbi:MAG: glutathione S-transferase [Pseudomonadales bacterium]|jgi:glutathione S-transferase
MYKGKYQLVGNELSMFSRKLEAQLRCQQIDWQWHFKTIAETPALEARAGTHFIPLLRTPENWLIHDTIAIGPMLSERFSHAAVIPPSDVQRACCFILEDFFNHWLGRFSVHTRWCYPHNVAWVGERFGKTMLLNKALDEALTEQETAQVAGTGQMMLDSFGAGVCIALGVGPDNEALVKADFHQFITALSAHLATSDFILGPRPCLADFALAGAFKAHFITDPEPKTWLGKFETLLTNYTNRVFSAKAAELDWAEDDAIPESISQLLDYAQATYYVDAPAKIKAGLNNEKYYQCDYGYGVVTARSQKRLEKSRLHVQQELKQLDLEKIKKNLEGYALLDFYLSGGVV